MRRRRRSLARALPQAGECAASLMPVEHLGPFDVVGGYHPTGSEIDPWLLMRRLERLGSRLALPVVNHRDDPLVFRAMGRTEDLVPDAYGIPAPPVSAAVLRPRLVITPVLAFDRAGRRLGQGAGVYDRTLAELRASGPVHVMGLAYAGQEVEAVPAGALDQWLDAILTEIGYRRFSKKDIPCA